MQNRNAAHALRAASAAIGCLALSAALAVSMHPFAFATSSEHDSKAQEYADSSAQKKAEAAEIQQQIDALQTRINEATAAHDAALAEYEAAVAAVEDADARLKEAEDKTVRLRDQLGSRAITMYKTGETNIVDVLLGSSSFDAFIRSWDAVRRIADQDAQLIEESKQARLDAYEAREEGMRQRSIAQAKTEEAEQARVEVVASQTEMQATLAGVNEEIARLDALQEEEEMAAEEARRLEEEAARLAAQKFNVGSGAIAGAISSGGWTHPLPGIWLAHRPDHRKGVGVSFRHRPRDADRHPGRGRQGRNGVLRGLVRNGRQRRHREPWRRRAHRVHASQRVQLVGRRRRSAGAVHRIRRQYRPLHRPASALQRRDQQDPHQPSRGPVLLGATIRTFTEPPCPSARPATKTSTPPTA